MEKPRVPVVDDWEPVPCVLGDLLEQRGCEIAVDRVSAFGSSETCGEALPLGAVSCREKPCQSLQEVWSKVHKALVMRLDDDSSVHPPATGPEDAIGDSRAAVGASSTRDR